MCVWVIAQEEGKKQQDASRVGGELVPCVWMLFVGSRGKQCCDQHADATHPVAEGRGRQVEELNVLCSLLHVVCLAVSRHNWMHSQSLTLGNGPSQGAGCVQTAGLEVFGG